MNTNTNTIQTNNNTKITKNTKNSNKNSSKNNYEQAEKEVNKKETKKIINWHEYNQALENRGSVLLCIDKELALGKYDKPLCKHTVGRPYEYADALIELMLTLRELYNLKLRQVVGFTKLWFSLMDIQIKIPNYSTLSRRAGKLDIQLLRDVAYKYKKEGIVLCVDSSGFKIHGEMEWKVRKHGKGKRREWLETHIAIDGNNRDIISVINTPNNVGDNTQVLSLLVEAEKNLEKIKSNRPLESIIGDGAYSSHTTYEIAKQFNAKLITPPHKNAILHMDIDKETHRAYDIPEWEGYNEAVRGVMKYGLKDWKVRVGYHIRSLVENAFYRLKIIFSDKTNYRTKDNQRTEQIIRAKIINQFNELGLPKYATTSSVVRQIR